MNDNNNSICHEHSGCMADIQHLKCSVVSLKRQATDMDHRVDSIMSKLNTVLGSIVVASILLILNFVFEAITN